uniref:EF-hand calcium-binding domain-containing protein 1-like n=1 Tax=Crassostrea virginica TaxID=6565 RepID=A0A8B8CBI0_CRAVI|nr:EF-hand calcium-binding domain-containing protein 1-like [Crassostrea virginica]
MLKFRYLTVLLLICLLTIEPSECWRRRRFRRFTRRVGRAIRRIGRTVQTVNTAVGVIRAVGAIAGAGKRSADNVLPELDVCEFSTLDLNKDGELDEDELVMLIQMSGLEELEELFVKLDQDDDKKISKEEFTQSEILQDACGTDDKDDEKAGEEDISNAT